MRDEQKVTFRGEGDQQVCREVKPLSCWQVE